MKKKPVPAHAHDAELRRRAEARLTARKEKSPPDRTSEADTLRLLHELEVHRVELEIQNEELNQARAESEALLQQYTVLYDFAPVGYFTLASDGAIRKVNFAGAKLLGVERRDLLGRGFGTFVSVESQAGFAAFLAKVFSSAGQKESCEAGLRNNESAPHWARIEAVVTIRDGGKAECQTMVIDITDRKQAEEARHESDRRVRDVLASITSGYQVIDRHGRYAQFNDAARKMIAAGGRDPDALLGQHVFEAFQESRDLSGSKALMRTLTERVPTEAENFYEAWQRWFAVRNYPTPDGGVAMFFDDITERKQAEAEILILAKFPSENPNPIFRIGKDGVLLYANASSGPLLDLWACQPGGKIPEDVQAHVFDAFQSHRQREVEIDCSGRIFSVIFAAVTEAGYVNGYGRDITARRQAEQTLMESEQQWKRAIANSPIPVMIHDEDDKVLQVSAGWTKYSGYTIEDIPTLADWTERAYGERTGSKKEYIDQLFSIDETVQNGEWIVQAKDGSKRYWEFQTTPLGKANNGKRVLHSLAVDLTERKRAEDALRLSEVKYRSLFEQTNDAVFLLDLEGNHLAVNERAAEMLGYTIDELMRLGMRDLSADMESSLQVMARLKQGERVPPYDRVFRLKNGEHLPVEINVEMVYRADGSPMHIQSVVRDITERKQAEEKINRQVEYLSALREIDEAIASGANMQSALDRLISHAGKLLKADAVSVLLVNQDARTVEFAAGSGFKADIIRGASVKLGESYAGRAAMEQRVVAIPDLEQEPNNLFRADFLEAEHFTGYYAAPLIVKGISIGVLEMFNRTVVERDEEWLGFFQTLAGQAAIAIEHASLIDELQRANAELERRVLARTAQLNQSNLELEQANRAKDEFLATMSHELRTPLNSILGLSETLLEQRRDPLSEYQQRSLGIIETSGHHLLDLINDVLDLSKIEAGRFDFYPQVIGVDAICQSSLAFVRLQASKKSINLKLVKEEQVDNLHADPRRLKQILVNLLTNAVKFTPEKGTVTLQIRSDADRDMLQFSVIDTGIGIAREDLHKLFQPFSQVDSSLTREFEGTGLGLALVRRLTDLHGGSVEVESEPGVGSRFTVNLPWGRDILMQMSAAQDRPPLRPATKPDSQPSIHPTVRAKVLLAEDNPANILTIGEYLESHGFEVVNAQDGVLALELADKTNPNIILMDIQMPALDGFEAMRRLRQNPRFASTPIIALTALAMPGDRERCLDAGANEYMSKPVSLKGLVQVMETLLGGENP